MSPAGMAVPWQPATQVAPPAPCSLPPCALPAVAGRPLQQHREPQVQAAASTVQQALAAEHPSSRCGQQLRAPPPAPPTDTTAPRLAAIRTRMQQCQHQRPASCKGGDGWSPTADIHLRSPLKGSGRALEHHLRELPPRHRRVLLALPCPWASSPFKVAERGMQLAGECPHRGQQGGCCGELRQRVGCCPCLQVSCPTPPGHDTLRAGLLERQRQWCRRRAGQRLLLPRLPAALHAGKWAAEAIMRRCKRCRTCRRSSLI
jgi:hypothetical protein